MIEKVSNEEGRRKKHQNVFEYNHKSFDIDFHVDVHGSQFGHKIPKDIGESDQLHLSSVVTHFTLPFPLDM